MSCYSPNKIKQNQFKVEVSTGQLLVFYIVTHKLKCSNYSGVLLMCESVREIFGCILGLGIESSVFMSPLIWLEHQHLWLEHQHLHPRLLFYNLRPQKLTPSEFVYLKNLQPG